MATFTSLIIEIGAKLDKLTRGLADASSKIASFAKDAASKLLDIGKWVVGGIGAGIAAITYLILSTTTKIAELDDTAKRFGLPVDELQRFTYAAKLAGVEADALGMAFQFMLKNVAEAGADPAGPAAESFRKLGLNAQALSKLDTAAQFTKIGEAFGKITNQAQRVQLAMDIFGRSGAQILNLFADNMEAAKKEFDELGLALTDTQVEAVAKFDDTRDKLGAIWGGFKEQVTAAVAPAFDFIYNYIIETIKRFGGIRQAALEVGKSIVDAMIIAMRGIGEFIDSVINGINRAIKMFDTLALAALRAAKFVTPKEMDDPNDKRSIFQLGFGGRNKIANPEYQQLNEGIDALQKDRAMREELLGKKSGDNFITAWFKGAADGLTQYRSQLDNMTADIMSGKNSKANKRSPTVTLADYEASKKMGFTGDASVSKIDNSMSDRALYEQNQGAYYERKFAQMDQTIADMKAVREQFPGTPFGTTGQNLQNMAAQKQQVNVNVTATAETGGDNIISAILSSLKFKTSVNDLTTANTNTTSKAVAN